MRSVIRRIKKYPSIVIIIAIFTVAYAARVYIVTPGMQSVGSVSATESNIQKVSLLLVDDYRQDRQHITADGVVESLQQAELRSQFTGPVARLHVQIGDTVKAGDMLISLQNADISAQLQQAEAMVASAQAALDGLRRGTRSEELELAEIQLNNLNVSLANAERDYENAVAKAESDIRGVYAGAVTALQISVSVLDNALTQADNILGVDNALANDSFEDILAFNDHTTLSAALANYTATKIKLGIVRGEISLLTTSSDPALIVSAMAGAEDALASGNQLLLSVMDVFNATPLTPTMTQAVLDAKKSVIQAARVVPPGVNVQYATLVGQRQAISTQQKVNTTVLSAAQSRVDEMQNAVAVAEQTLALKRAGATPEQIRVQEAQFQQAKAALANISAQLGKTVIRAPIDGEVASLPVRPGELVTLGQAVASIVNLDGLQVKCYVSETDFSTIDDGNPVKVGADATGKVSRVAPSIDAKTRKIEVDVLVDDPQEAHLVVGQNVRVQIATNPQFGDTAYVLPLQAVRVVQDGAFVYTVDAQSVVQEVPVVLGELTGESVAIPQGLRDGQKIIAVVYELKAGQRVEVLE